MPPSFLTPEALLLATAVVALVAITALVAALVLWRRWQRVFQKGAPPADMLTEVLSRLQRAEQKLAAGEPRLNALEDIGRVAVQKVGFIRFNPFSDTGGDQSFAAALLDQNDNGFVISSLYAREGVRVYAKEIASGKPKHPLSTEEETVLQRAMRPNA